MTRRDRGAPSTAPTRPIAPTTYPLRVVAFDDAADLEGAPYDARFAPALWVDDSGAAFLSVADPTDADAVARVLRRCRLATIGEAVLLRATEGA